jgi:hypothetical protein
MTLTLDEVARFTAGSGSNRRGDQARHALPPLVPNRRQFIKGALVVGMGSALGLVGSVRLPRLSYGLDCRAALHNDMDTSCAPSNDGHGCDPACGPTMPTAGACRTDTWHKYGGVDYQNRPNVCSNNPGQDGADGWFWQRCCPNSCGDHPTKFKCHDGCRKVEGIWKRSVCRTFECQGGLC